MVPVHRGELCLSLTEFYLSDIEALSQDWRGGGDQEDNNQRDQHDDNDDPALIEISVSAVL